MAYDYKIINKKVINRVIKINLHFNSVLLKLNFRKAQNFINPTCHRGILATIESLRTPLSHCHPQSKYQIINTRVKVLLLHTTINQDVIKGMKEYKKLNIMHKREGERKMEYDQLN